MITAILKQNIKKRERKLLPDFSRDEKPQQTKIVNLKNNFNKIHKFILNRYMLIALLLALCSLVIVSFKSLPRHRQAPIVLPTDPMYENAVFSYMISADVRLDTEDASDNAADPAAEAGNNNPLKITYHQLARGESISTLAAKYKLNIDTIISFNNIINARAVKIGTKLAIPNANGIMYKVRRGDNLSGIANRFKIGLNSLLDWNNINSEVIQPNTEYFIPGALLTRNELNNILGILFIYPVSGSRLTSTFGWRKDPFSGVRSYHNGIDLANDFDTPIKAVMDGTVVKKSYSSIFGRYLIVKHSDGFQTLYGHMDKYNTEEKDKIKQGQVIGYMGSTGYSTGTHVHFAIFKNGEPVDPLKYLQSK